MPDLYLVGVRVLRTMLDPATGFQAAASESLYNKRAVQFAEVVRTHIYRHTHLCIHADLDTYSQRHIYLHACMQT